MAKLNIAHITAADMALRYLLVNQLQELKQAGFEVAGISSPGEHVPYLVAQGIRHIPVTMQRRFSPFADLATLLRLYRVFRREQFTIVHTHFAKPGLLGQLAARMSGVAIGVDTGHGSYFH